MNDEDPRERARMTADLARKTAEFQVLQRVSAELNSTLELDEIYDAALRTMGKRFHAEAQSVRSPQLIDRLLDTVKPA